jgi:hypothetical protein
MVTWGLNSAKDSQNEYKKWRKWQKRLKPRPILYRLCNNSRESNDKNTILL